MPRLRASSVIAVRMAAVSAACCRHRQQAQTRDAGWCSVHMGRAGCSACMDCAGLWERTGVVCARGRLIAGRAGSITSWSPCVMPSCCRPASDPDSTLCLNTCVYVGQQTGIGGTVCV